MNSDLRGSKSIVVFVGALFAIGGGCLLTVSAEEKLGWIEVPVHYRLSFEVKVAGATYTGSTVVQETYTRLPEWERMSMPSDREIYKGEAAVLKVEGGKVLCLLPGASHLIFQKRYHSVADIAYRLLTAEKTKNDGITEQVPINVDTAAHAAGSADIPFELLPPMIVIDDMMDPRSAHVFDPEHPERTLGSEAQFLGAQIAVTTDPVSTGIENVLPWLNGGNSLPLLTHRDDAFNQENHGMSLLRTSFY